MSEGETGICDLVFGFWNLEFGFWILVRLGVYDLIRRFGSDLKFYTKLHFSPL